jgi:plasmid stabilization system protein ParE
LEKGWGDFINLKLLNLFRARSLKIGLALTAEHDLENIWIYTITEWSEEHTNGYVGLIEQGFSQLLENP